MDKHFFNSFLVYGGSVGLSRILPILMLPLYLTNLGTDAYGKVEVIFAFFTFLLIFGLLQLETALQRMYFKVENKAELFYSILVITTLFSICIAMITSYLSGDISILLFKSETESRTIVIAAVSVIFANISTVCMVYLRYKDKPAEFVILTLGQVAITALTTYISLVTFHYGTVGYFYGLLAGWLFVAICSLYLITNNMKFSWNISHIKESLEFAAPQIPARLASFFVQFGNRFFVLYIIGTQAVALMSLSIKFAALFQLLMIAFSLAWNPFLYRNEGKLGLEKKVNNLFRALLAALSVLHFITILLAELIIVSFFDKEYHAASQYVILGIIPVQLLIIKEVVESGIKLANKTKYISYAYFISVSIAATLMLFSKTIEQVLLSTILGTLSLVLLSWYFSEKVHKIRYSRVGFSLYITVVLISLAFN